MFKQRHIASISIFMVLIMVNVTGYSQELPLTQSEKMEDFNRLYEVLKENYLLFDGNMRLNGIDWLGNYEKYRTAVSETKNDREFFDLIMKIVQDLNNGHASVIPPVAYKLYLQAYRTVSQQDDTYNKWVEVLTANNADAKNNYWLKITGGEEVSITFNEDEEPNKQQSVSAHLSFKEYPDKNTAVLSLNSFPYYAIEADRDTLMTIFSIVKDYDNFIINIQGNTGGATDYWEKLIVPYLISAPIEERQVLAFRNTPFIKSYYPAYFENATSNLPDLPNLPPELSSGNNLYRYTNRKIEPKAESIEYAGTVYLLVDHYVYSASEAFTLFCKQTGFAAVVGTVTGGEGIGRDPVIFSLPNSGLLIRFSVEMGLNPDGSANWEMKTIPDILLNGATSKERLEQLFELIVDGS